MRKYSSPESIQGIPLNILFPNDSAQRRQWHGPKTTLLYNTLRCLHGSKSIRLLMPGGYSWQTVCIDIVSTSQVVAAEPTNRQTNTRSSYSVAYRYIPVTVLKIQRCKRKTTIYRSGFYSTTLQPTARDGSGTVGTVVASSRAKPPTRVSQWLCSRQSIAVVAVSR